MATGETDFQSAADEWIQHPSIGVRMDSQAPATPVFVKLHIRPKDPLGSMNLADVVRFSAFGEMGNGALKPLKGITWTCSDPKIASISKEGEALGLAPGKVLIKAAHGESGLSDSTTLLIPQPGKGPTLQSVTIEPSDPTFKTFEPQQFSIFGTFTDGSRHELTDQFEWTSPDPAILSFTETSPGLATPGTQSGTVAISADNHNGSAASTNVTVDAPVLRGLKIVPPKDLSIRRGVTENFKAVGTFSDGSTLELTKKVRWNSSDAKLLKISADGLATGLAPGKIIVTATDVLNPTVKDSITATVLGLRQITINPEPATIKSGDQPQFTAQGLYADGSVADVTDMVMWESSPADVVKIDRFSGAVISSNPGTATITASYPDKSQVAGTRQITVE